METGTLLAACSWSLKMGAKAAGHVLAAWS